MRSRTTGPALWIFALGLSCMQAEAQEPPPIPEVSGAQAVRETATQKGTVRVIARVAPSAAESAALSPDMAVASAQRSVLRSFSAAAPGVKHAEAITDSPFVVLELDQAQLDRLIASGEVTAVAEDRLSKPT